MESWILRKNAITLHFSCYHGHISKSLNINLHHLWKNRRHIYIFSCFTGMEEASCLKAAFVSDYLDNTDDFIVIQGPAARIRPSRLPENYFSCEFLSVTPGFLFPSSAASLSVSFVCNQCGWTCPLSLSSVDYEGLVKNLSVCEVFQMWLLYW